MAGAGQVEPYAAIRTRQDAIRLVENDGGTALGAFMPDLP